MSFNIILINSENCDYSAKLLSHKTVESINAVINVSNIL